MAKVGLKYPVYAPLSVEAAAGNTYTKGAVLAKAISAKIDITSNDEKLYADDAAAEVDQSFSSGKLTVGVDDFYDPAKVALLGYIEAAAAEGAAQGDGKELTDAGSTGAAPYVGFGFYGKVIRNNVPFWRAIWLHKVQFSEPSDEFETKGEKAGFKTPELNGTIMQDASGHYKSEQTFASEASAKAWLDKKAVLTA
jgi:phi13 family phage major tail protein